MSGRCTHASLQPGQTWCAHLNCDPRTTREILQNAFLVPMPSVFALCKFPDVSPDRAVSVTLLGRGKVNVPLAATLGDWVRKQDVQ